MSLRFSQWRPLAFVLQISQYQHHKLHHQLERWYGLQRSHTQTPVRRDDEWPNPLSPALKCKRSWNPSAQCLSSSFGFFSFTVSFSSFALLRSPSFSLRPDLVEYNKLKRSNPTHNLQSAFNVAEQQLGVTKLLDPEGEWLMEAVPLCRINVEEL